MFPGNDIVSSLIAVQMGGTGGGGTPSNVIEIFKTQPVLAESEFYDYKFKFCNCPDGMPSEGFALFDTESVALGAVNLTPRPSCPQGSVQLLAYGAKPAAKASWTVLKPDGRKLGVTVSERADGYWLAPASTMLFIR